MAQPNEEKLLEAIQRDDVKAFTALSEETRCGNYRLGRFPVLSLLYLYRARKILSMHREKLLKITSWTEIKEPAIVAKRFSDKAGKCLRLYFNEVVTPIEMLLILDRTKEVKKMYPLVKASEAVKARLQSVYSIKYSLRIRFEGNEILIDRRPLNKREKKRIFALCAGSFLAAAIVIAAPVTAVSLNSYRSGGDVTRLSHINFAANTTYTLKNDIKIPANYSVKKVNCTIIGEGNKLILGKNATLGEFSGKMSDLNVETEGSPVFSVCTPAATLQNVNVSVNANVSVSGQGTALIALYNYGVFDGVNVEVSGTLSALAGKLNGTQELVFGGLVANNAYTTFYSQVYYGTIKNCSVHYSDFTLKGELAANASFGGIVGVNNGIVESCTVTGSIAADTFDLGGVCYINNNTLSKDACEANLSQRAEDEGWTPIVAGIAIENAAVVEQCKNTGALRVTGADAVICGGIAARVYGTIDYCLSSGDIFLEAKSAYAGCIFGRSEVISDGWYVYCGFANNCIAEGKITASLHGEEKSCVGGVGGFVQEGLLGIGSYIGGGAKNCFFLGEVEGEFTYFGNIIGVCAEDIYESNSYTSNGEAHVNFEENYYLDNRLPSFGAVVSTDEEFREVGGKGAFPLTAEEIKGKEAYQKILQKLGV